MSTSESGTNGASQPVDLHRVLMEIDEEVRAKRASGDLPADFERELDMVFARFAPAGAVEGDFDQLLARAEQQSFIDLLAPNESVRPGVPQVKRVVQKTIRWYVRHVVEQFSGFAHTITKATRKLSERVQVIEQMTAGYTEMSGLEPSDRHARWDSEIVQALRGLQGRVLHARCGVGELVAELKRSGVDAYGVDPASATVATGSSEEDALLDLRPDDEREHLRTLAPGVLDGLVLAGCVDVLPVGAQVELADLAALVIRNGGVVVIVTTGQRAWSESTSPITSDLAPGRPLHAETWAHLLSERGFVIEAVQHAVSPGELNHVPGTDETSAAMNANIDRLNHMLCPPQSSLVVARR